MHPPRPLQGEVWLVYTPGLPSDPHQPRPALVISENRRNRFRPHVMVVPVFSTGILGPTHIPLDAGVGGLRRDSVLFCEETTTLAHEFLVDGPLGLPVPDHILNQARRGIRHALGETFPESTT